MGMSFWYFHFIFSQFHLHDGSPIDVDSVVVNHFYNGYTEVAADAKRNAKAKSAEDGDDVTFGKAKAATIQKGWAVFRGCHWTAIFCQLNVVLFSHISAIDLPTIG